MIRRENSIYKNINLDNLAGKIYETNSIEISAKEFNISRNVVYKLFARYDKSIKTKEDIIDYYCNKFNIKKPEKEARKKYEIKKILMFSKDGKFEKEFSRFKEIREEFSDRQISESHIYAVCNGKKKTAYGKIWKYKT